MIDQHAQHVEGPGPDQERLPVAQEATLMPLQGESTKNTDAGIYAGG